MSKWFGKIGFCETVETEPSVYEERMTERDYYGDMLRNTRRLQSAENVNDNVALSNQLSVIMDPYAQEHFSDIRYVTLYGGKWKVTDAEVNYPRVTLTLGGLWHGNEPEREET